MDPPFRELSDADLERHGRALRALCRGLRAGGSGPSGRSAGRGGDVGDGGEGGVEDVVQDTWVAALERGTHSPLRLLRAIARNLARRQRRTRARRQRREQAVARASEAPSAADVAAETELLQHIAHLVHRLDEPFRTAIHLRYWQDLPPQEIAVRLGVPRNTVRSRLQRALALLRGQLEASGERRAWAVPLAGFLRTAAGREHHSPLAAGIGGLPVALMSQLMSKTLAVVSISLAPAAAVLVVLHSGERPAGPRADPPGRGPAVASTGTDVPTAPTTEGTSTAPTEGSTGIGTGGRRPVRGQPPAPVMVRGRCVRAEDGAPFAHGIVAMRAERSRGASSSSFEPEPAYAPPEPAAIADDGRFELSFAAPPQRATVSIGGGDRAPVEVHWEHLEPGAELDLGTIPLPRGALLQGRVVDPAGRPQAGVGIVLERSLVRPAPGEARPLRAVHLRAGPDGAFASAARLVAGRYRIGVRPPHQNAGPAQVHHAPGATAGVEIVVARALGELRGVVLDPDARPVAGAPVFLSLPGRDRLASWTAADGRFLVLRGPGDPAKPVRLVVDHTYHERLVTEEAFTWGRRDVVLNLEPAPTLPIRVVRASDGKPVTRYAVDIGGPGRAWRSHGVADRPGGRFDVPDIRAGRVLLFVRPEFGGLAPSGYVTAHVPAGPTEDRAAERSEVPIELERAATRRLRVVRRTGEPVAGTRVQLVEALGGPAASISLASRVGGQDTVGRHRSLADSGFAWQDARTDEAGLVECRAPAGRPYTVRVLGPGHRPRVVRNVVLEAPAPPLDAPSEPLRIVVEAGAVLRGRLTPPALLEALWPDADTAALAEQPGFRSIAALARPAVFLEGPAARFPEARDQRVRLDEDGRFTCEGVPAGEWQVVLYMPIWVTPGALMPTIYEVRLARVALRAGQAEDVTVDGGDFVPAELSGRVTLDGEVAARKTVAFETLGPIERRSATPMVKTDAHGRFSATLPAGRHRIDLLLPADAAGEARPARTVHTVHTVRTVRTVRSAAPVTLRPGERAEWTLQLVRARIAVRVLDAAGEPVAGRAFSILAGGGGVRIPAGTSDARGVVTIEPAPPNEFELVAWPEELLDAAAQRRFLEADPHPRPRWQDVLVTVGSIVPTGEREQRVELRMPR